MNLTELDKLLESVELHVRTETLVSAWELTDELERKRGVVLVVTMLARPGMEERLELATREFIAATLRLPGALGSSLHRPESDPRTLLLMERFESEESFARHMASDYFARLQLEQRTLLAAPVQVVFLERG